MARGELGCLRVSYCRVVCETVRVCARAGGRELTRRRRGSAPPPGSRREAEPRSAASARVRGAGARESGDRAVTNRNPHATCG